MKEINLSQGKVAFVDDEDFDYINQWKWCTQKHGHTFYAIRSVYHPKSTIRMHRQILNITGTRQIADHKNRNGLDNRKQNIRICTFENNSQNKKKRLDATSIYKGVNLRRKRGRKDKWECRITVSKKDIYLGYFPFTREGEINAAKRYDEFAQKYFGEYAKLNFPP